MKWFVDNYLSKPEFDENANFESFNESIRLSAYEGMGISASVELTFSIAPKKIKVLDVGSYGVNGTYKDLFDESKFHYTGLDMEEGPNVDIALKNPYDWNEIGTDSFDVVISGQAFEHIEFFWITMSEMTRVLKKDGLLCVIAPNGFGEHRCPVDCYRFFSDGMIALARYVSLEPLHAHTNCAPSESDAAWYSGKQADSMLIARKPYDGQPKYVDLRTYKCVPPDQQALRGSFKTLADRFKMVARNKLISSNDDTLDETTM
jgi:SAM-dependent methyltransferase